MLADAGAFRGKVTPHHERVVPQSPGTAKITTHDLILSKIQKDQESYPNRFSRTTNLEIVHLSHKKQRSTYAQILNSPYKRSTKPNHDEHRSKKHNLTSPRRRRSSRSRKCTEANQNSWNRKQDADTTRPNQHTRGTRQIKA